jgi:hypothetical protein
VTLEEHLSALYRERVIGGGAGGAAAALAAALAADPVLRERAARRLAELGAVPAERCFISAQHRRSLEAALAANPKE